MPMVPVIIVIEFQFFYPFVLRVSMNCIAAVTMGVSWGGVTVRGTHIHPIRVLI